ncbi:Hypothetical predicted protein [Octopus vulgaris]|uniref:Uncharacterized protein n=1 Tax=Octopus vulgaris TaxID=6645 RepID=A0AA36AUY4_OCTVU|nr:Hypothetical predicted protein [Octopus vulgaris]
MLTSDMTFAGDCEDQFGFSVQAKEANFEKDKGDIRNAKFTNRRICKNSCQNLLGERRKERENQNKKREREILKMEKGKEKYTNKVDLVIVSHRMKTYIKIFIEKEIF